MSESEISISVSGPVPFLFGGRLCLDFVNTVNSRARPATRDYLPDWPALLGWCRQTALFDAIVLRRLEQRAEAAPADAEAAHAAAIALRESLFRIFRSVLDRNLPPEEDMRLLNRRLQDARQRQVLVFDGGSFSWIWDEMRLDLHAPACAVALSAAALLAEEDLRRVKACPPPDGCGWLFYDETKNASRRWCSMEHCGSAAKARRFNSRRRAQETGREG